MYIFQKKVSAADFKFSPEDKALIMAITKRYASSSGDRDDLEQNARIALWKASQDFDPNRGVKFSTLAATYIRNELYKEIQKSRGIHIPEHKLAKARKLSIINEDLEQKLGRRSTLKELAETSGYSIEEISELRGALVYTISLDMPLYKDSSATRIETVVDGNVASQDGLQQVIDSEFKNKLNILLSKLTKKEALVLSLRFGYEDGELKTLDQIAKVLGEQRVPPKKVSREWVRLIEKKAIKKIKSNKDLREWVLPLLDYLNK